MEEGIFMKSGELDDDMYITVGQDTYPRSFKVTCKVTFDELREYLTTPLRKQLDAQEATIRSLSSKIHKQESLIQSLSSQLQTQRYRIHNMGTRR